jgi:putative transposase
MRARIGQKNGQVRQWARRGTRPRQPADQRSDNAYLFGAICPARGVGAALALPYADAAMMQLHLDEISRNVAAGAHAVLRHCHTRRFRRNLLPPRGL